MSEENKVPPEDQGTNTENSWREVGRQFQALGESLAQTVRTTWQDEETQRRLHEVHSGLESMVRDVADAINDSANTPQGQRIRQEAGRTAESVRIATEQTIQEVRPQLISALQQLNQELEKLVRRIEERQNKPAGSPPAGEPPQDPEI